jgi:DNA-binding SARP family transcriptional activator/pimeloyl-ACP methyl ester carboxylesterase
VSDRSGGVPSDAGPPDAGPPDAGPAGAVPSAHVPSDAASSGIGPSGHTGVRLLGPVDVVVDGRPVPLPRSHARTMLAALAVRAGHILSTDALIDAVWGDDPPRTATHALHVHASRLRKLDPDGLRIVGRPGGYVLQLGPGQLDTDRFETLAARGRAELASGRPDAAAAVLRSALALWRGPPLADVPWERFADGDTRRWEELRHATHEVLVDAELAAGRHLEVVPDAESLVRDQPFRERRWGQLMVALYRAGRQAEALDAYRRVRTLLTEELGIEPSLHLRELEAKILRQDDSLRSIGPTGLGGSTGPGSTGSPGDDLPITRFTHGPVGRLAYQELGDGPAQLVIVPAYAGHLEIRWEEPRLSHFYRRLARSARVVLYDKRGTGLSDRDTGIPGLREQVDDVLAVMDAAGVERATLFGNLDGGAIALLTAATHPDRVEAVVTYACFTAFELLGAAATTLFEGLRGPFAHGLPDDEVVRLMAPSRVGDASFTRWLGRYGRMGLGVGGALAVLDRLRDVDVRAALGRVTVPVLALHREHDRLVPAGNATYIANHVRDGRVVVLPGTDHIIWAEDVDVVADHVESVLAEVRSRHVGQPGR